MPLVELAAKHKVPITPRTGGSSLAGQAINHSLVIDMSRHLDQVLEVNTEEQWARVQPGIVLDEFNLYLRQYGLQFGPDPASSNRACMGGIVSNNSTGSHSIMYGMTTDHVLESDVILSDGTKTHIGFLNPDEMAQYQARPGLEGDIYKKIHALATENVATIQAGTPRHWRRCGGYNLDRFIDEGVTFNFDHDRRFNLSKIVSGAEGTLAVLTEIKLNLVPIPKKTALAIVHYNDLKEALSSVPILLEVQPSVVELLDNMGLRLCREVPQLCPLAGYVHRG